jgi:hypothetical protein
MGQQHGVDNEFAENAIGKQTSADSGAGTNLHSNRINAHQSTLSNMKMKTGFSTSRNNVTSNG